MKNRKLLVRARNLDPDDTIPGRIIDAVMGAPFRIFDRVKGHNAVLRVIGVISFPILAVLCMPLVILVVPPCAVCEVIIDMWKETK